MSVMPAQKPDTQRRSPTPYALQVRLTKAQYAYLLLHAEAAGSMGAALRVVLDDKIDTTPVYNDLGDDYQGPPSVASTSMRWVLEHADLDNLDELAATLALDE
jgi:hypothetical protein